MSLIITVIASVLLALAINAASDEDAWPGPFGLIQRHPFAAVAVLAAVLLLATGFNFLYQRTGPQPATDADLTDVAEQLHDRFDVIELAQVGDDDRVLDRLPPYVRLLMKADSGRADTWQLIASFAEENSDPWEVAREWAAAPPAALKELSGRGHLVVVELLLAYGQPAAAARVLEDALGLGISPRSYWLFRRAQIAWLAEGPESATAISYLTKAEEVDPSYPLPTAARLCHEKRWLEAAEAIKGWQPGAVWERDAVASISEAVFLGQDRIDDAVVALEAISGATPSAGLLLRLARLLRFRSVSGDGDSRWKDACRAVEVALRARNLRRLWNGDSGEAVAAAAEAALLADDPAQAWVITRPAPDGVATLKEAGDARVLPLGAMAAALTGRHAQARDLMAQTTDSYVRLKIEAEIASTQIVGGWNAEAMESWRRVLAAAPNDEERLQALRAMALEGAKNEEILEELRGSHPAAVEDIEKIQQVMAATGSESDESLRRLETDTPLASMRRAELLRANGELQMAAEVLVDATARWNNPRLLLIAVDCYMEAGAWEKAEALAQQVLAESGVLWQGRTTVLRRLVDIQTALKNWEKVAASCRALLEVDENDDDARWELAFAEFRDGDPARAWKTLRRLGVVHASTPNRAMFLLDLVRRFAEAEEVARTALAQLHAFPDNETVHAAAIGAVTMRTDRTDLPEDIGREVSEGGL